MKTHTPRYKVVIKEINDAIKHANGVDLPIESIELTCEEWDAFVEARTTLVNGRRNERTRDLLAGKQIYRGVKIYKEGT